MIDKSSPVPIYQLEELIKKMIENNEFKSGDSLPSEREFSETFQISRMTVRQAINQLVQSGLLHRIQGNGTFVAERKIEKALQGLTSFSEDMLGRGLTPSSRLLADNMPMAIETNYISVKLLPELSKEAVNKSLYHYIHEHISLSIQSADQTIEAKVADQLEAEYLQIQEGSPILVISRVTMLEDGTPIETIKSIYRADRYKFFTKIKKEQ